MDFFSTEPGALRRQIFVTALLTWLAWYTGAALDLSKWKAGIGAALSITQRNAISNGVLGIAFLVISAFLMVRAYFVFVAEIRMAGQKVGDLKKIVSDLADYSLAAQSCADAARELQRSVEKLGRSLEQTPQIIEGTLTELSVAGQIASAIKLHAIDQALFDVKGELAAWFMEMDREMALVKHSISGSRGLDETGISRNVFQDSVIQNLRAPSEYSADILRMVDSVVRGWGNVLGPLEEITESQGGLRNFSLLKVKALN